MTGEQHHHGDLGRFGLCQLPRPDPACQPGDHARTGLGWLVAHQGTQVLGHRDDGAVSLLRRGFLKQDRSAVVLEEVVVGVRHTEQLTDHQRRHGQRELRHQIRRPRPGEHRTEQLVDDPLYAGPHGRHPLDGERRNHRSPQPVVLRVVHHDEAQPRRTEPLREVREAGSDHLGTGSGIGEHCPLLGIPGHQPRSASVPQPHPPHRGFRLISTQCRRGIERAPGGPLHREVTKLGQRGHRVPFLCCHSVDNDRSEQAPLQHPRTGDRPRPMLRPT